MHVHQELENFYLGALNPSSFNDIAGMHLHSENSRSTRVTSVKAMEVKADDGALPLTERSRTGVVLIVENFDEIRGIIANHFTRQGYDVYSSATLFGALAIAIEETPQTVIIDHDLQGESSIHMIEQLREALPNGFIILVGESETSAMIDRAIQAGASKVLSTKYDPKEIDKLVEDASSLLLRAR